MMQLAVSRVVSKFATFSGRAGRPEFWWWALFTLLVSVAAQLLDWVVFGTPMISFTEVEDATRVFYPLASLAIFLPNLAVMVRRLHDTGRSGWWVLIVLIPILGLLVLIYFLAQRGESGVNGYGPPDPLV